MGPSLGLYGGTMGFLIGAYTGLRGLWGSFLGTI